MEPGKMPVVHGIPEQISSPAVMNLAQNTRMNRLYGLQQMCCFWFGRVDDNVHTEFVNYLWPPMRRKPLQHLSENLVGSLPDDFNQKWNGYPLFGVQVPPYAEFGCVMFRECCVELLVKTRPAPVYSIDMLEVFPAFFLALTIALNHNRVVNQEGIGQHGVHQVFLGGLGRINQTSHAVSLNPLAVPASPVKQFIVFEAFIPEGNQFTD